MSQGIPNGGEQYPAGEQEYAPYPAEQKSPPKVSIPTILASAGVAAVVSALIVTIGVVGLVISNNNYSNNSSARTPAVVNLGAAQKDGAQLGGTTAPAAGTAAPQPGAPAPQPVAPAPPVEQVPESGGDAGTGGAGANQGATPGQAPQTQAPAQQQPVAAPAALTAGQLNTKVKLIMNTGASRATRSDELQGGERALGSVDAAAQMLQVNGAGFTYKMIDPVELKGTTLTAPLQMSLVGNGSRNRQLTWVWMDDKWKLSNTSVCEVASYAMIPCTV